MDSPLISGKKNNVFELIKIRKQTLERGYEKGRGFPTAGRVGVAYL